MSLAIIILAAGKGTRMESDLAKVLHPLCGKPLVVWALESASQLSPDRVVVVVGHQAQAVQDRVLEAFPHTRFQLEFARQEQMLGTGHAVQQCEAALRDFSGDIVVTCGDVPLLKSSTLQNLVQRRRETNAAAALLYATIDEPGSYGRVIRDEDGTVHKIVEAKDASHEEKLCRDVNAGTYCFESTHLWRELAKIGNTNASGEYYLTDVVGLLTENNERVVGVPVSEREMTGINTRAQLEQLESEVCGEISGGTR